MSLVRRTAWLALALALAPLASSCAGQAGRIEALQNLPDDVAALVDETWRRFAAAMPAAAACMEPVELLLVEDVTDGDAVYVVSDRRIEIEIPTSPARFPESLIHELAHHVEATCPTQADVRTRFLAAQGFSADDPWRDGESWAQIPSEHFAEAVVQVVLEDRLLHADVVKLDDVAIELVRAWGAG